MNALLISVLLLAAAQAADCRNVMARDRSQIPSSSGRIVGGSEASVGQFKYQVGVFMDGANFCGGSLISDEIVLTSAQCVKGFSSFEVHCGALNIQEEGEEGRVVVTTSDATAHESFSTFFLVNDIAVIRLKQVVSGPNIAAVRLPKGADIDLLFVGEVGTVSGWGKTADDGAEVNDLLKFAEVEVIPNADCQVFFGTTVVQETTLCTSSSRGTLAPCDNDYGGPLVIPEADDIPTLVGVMSFRSGAGCESLAPTGFSRVTKYLEWITNNAGIPIRP